jgi:hypothetical protein
MKCLVAFPGVIIAWNNVGHSEEFAGPQRAVCERKAIAEIKSGSGIDVPQASAPPAASNPSTVDVKDPKSLRAACELYVRRTGKFHPACPCPLP